MLKFIGIGSGGYFLTSFCNYKIIKVSLILQYNKEFSLWISKVLLFNTMVNMSNSVKNTY